MQILSGAVRFSFENKNKSQKLGGIAAIAGDALKRRQSCRDLKEIVR